MLSYARARRGGIPYLIIGCPLTGIVCAMLLLVSASHNGNATSAATYQRSDSTAGVDLGKASTEIPAEHASRALNKARLVRNKMQPTGRDGGIVRACRPVSTPALPRLSFHPSGARMLLARSGYAALFQAS